MLAAAALSLALMFGVLLEFPDHSPRYQPQLAARAVLRTCEADRAAIGAAFADLQACTADAECVHFEPGGFRCWLYVNAAAVTAPTLRQIAAYVAACSPPEVECAFLPGALPPACVDGRCVIDAR